MKKNFYFFRHGETEYNRLQLRQGRGINIGLNPKGREQAAALAHSLEDKGIEVIFSSPLIRALETANAVSAHLQIPVEIADGLTEGHFGEAEGLAHETVRQRWPGILAAWYLPEQMDQGFPGGESKRDIQRRMLQTMEVLLADPRQTIAVSSHSSALRLLLMTMGGTGEKLPNARAVHVLWQDGLWQICRS